MKNLPNGIQPDITNNVYYDTEKLKYYMIQWIENGNTPWRHYIEDFPLFTLPNNNASVSILTNADDTTPIKNTKLKPCQWHWKKIKRNFPWDEVANVMVLLEWEWAPKSAESTFIPGKKDLKKLAKDLIYNSYNTHETISTGGFTATWFPEEPKRDPNQGWG